MTAADATPDQAGPSNPAPTGPGTRAVTVRQGPPSRGEPQPAPRQAAGAEPVFDLEQDFDEHSLYPLRAAVTAHAAAFGATEDVIDTLLIVTGELASNAILHGGGTGRLYLWHTPTTILCRISDDGPGIADPHTVGTTEVPLAAPNGRGMWIARQLCRHVDIVSDPTGTSITVAIDLRPS
ncbi:ATP-binding protein [Dactylosporangium aurantiacum]|uniref:ATP-binding protein n=1 Tax=Dactylosporangium aurantiacum TaxID=35754 RepID=A0A9Q9MG60_9ACTN|nr:ATP-binding protein [Dactylosporangium aurantiacum]MDG6109563.1 ATP-binding protein [Dactylosporangium aurantiacum]UWZ51281.1 ATP-binding protein [Dactylosporangium aurantiacum]